MKNEMICCPPFNPKDWDDKLLKWDNKKFITAKVRSFIKSYIK